MSYKMRIICNNFTTYSHFMRHSNSEYLKRKVFLKFNNWDKKLENFCASILNLKSNYYTIFEN